VHTEIGSTNTEKIICDSYGYVLWFFEKRNLPSNIYIESLYNTHLLHFHNVNLHNFGRYYCFGWDAIKLRYFLAENNMIVHGKY